MRSIILNTGLAALTMLAIAACSSQPRYDNQTGYGNAREYRVRCDSCGTVERIERVRLQDNSIGAGAVLGAIIGGVAGSNFGSGDGRTVAIAAGAVAGGVIGHEIQKNNRKRQYGYRFDVNLDDGRQARVTQLKKNGLHSGDSVIIRDHEVQYLR